MKKEALKVDEKPELLTYQEAAEFMRITPNSLRQRVSNGTIPAMCIVRMAGTKKSSVRFRRRELEKWLLGS